jgi:carbon monoxide dehydrogenase subunit G
MVLACLHDIVVGQRCLPGLGKDVEEASDEAMERRVVEGDESV